MVKLMPLPPIISCSSKIQNGSPFWCRLTQVVLEKRQLNGCSSSKRGTMTARAVEAKKFEDFSRILIMIFNDQKVQTLS